MTHPTPTLSTLSDRIAVLRDEAAAITATFRAMTCACAILDRDPAALASDARRVLAAAGSRAFYAAARAEAALEAAEVRELIAELESGQ